MTEEIVQEYTVGEFRGNYPIVPIADGVDIEAIKQGDPDALFITLPIAEIGAVSNNGLLYDEALVDSIAEQINHDRPGGIFGHLKDDDRSTSFPLPSGLWVGAKRHQQRLWAISYIPPGAAKSYVQNLKHVGGQIATSIYGKGKYEKVGDGVRRLTNFKLESLDFAPPSRAALGMGAVPHLTREMETEQEPIMADNKAQFIAELTVSDIAGIPAAVRDAIVAEASKQDETSATIAELTSTVKAKDDHITVLETTVAEYQRRDFVRAVDEKVAELTNWAVNDSDKDANGKSGKDKLDALRAMFRRAILEKLGAESKLENIAEIATAAWEEIKPIAEMMRDALAGPAAIVNGKVRDTGGRPKLEDTPENRARAVAAMGINI